MSEDRPNTKIITEYVHGGGEAHDDYSDLWDHEAPQQETFHYCLYEEAVKIEVDLDTGRWRYLAFGGYDLVKPTPWFG